LRTLTVRPCTSAASNIQCWPRLDGCLRDEWNINARRSFPFSRNTDWNKDELELTHGHLIAAMQKHDSDNWYAKKAQKRQNKLSCNHNHYSVTHHMLLVKKLVSFCYTEGRGPKTSEFCQRGHCTNTSRLCHVFVIYCGQCFLHTGEHTQSRYTIRCKNDSDLFIHPMSNIHISFPTQNKL